MNDFLYDDDERDAQREEGIFGDENDYGRCPVCGGHGESLTQGFKQWMVCHEHKIKWRIGVGFFSLFQRDRPAKWDRPGQFLKDYREVTPLMGDELADNAEIERFKRLLD